MPLTSNARQSARNAAIRLPVALAVAVTGIGTVGYRIIEGWSWADSLYMVFITLSTVGFSEVHELSEGGRTWTIVLIVAGVTTIGYLAARLFELIMEGSIHGLRRQRMMEKFIESVSGHTIICGYGRVGRQVVKDFLAAKKDIVVIDEVDHDGRFEALGVPHVVGNAEVEDVLRRAGIEQVVHFAGILDEIEEVFLKLVAVLTPDVFKIALANGLSST